MKKEKYFFVFITVAVFILVYKLNFYEAVTAFSLPIAKKVIVIDAGHGGFDPGKIGKSGDDEQYINLKISQKLQNYLEQSGSYVIMTREDNEALANKKNEDLRLRKYIVNNSSADIMISIHQNSFPKVGAKGAQVFYYNSSKEGKLLAEQIQNKLKETVDLSNNREIKANTDYYVLRTTQIPSVIVECGFLSNPEEEKLLNTEYYQEKVAWAIYQGVIEYFSENEKQKLQL